LNVLKFRVATLDGNVKVALDRKCHCVIQGERNSALLWLANTINADCHTNGV
jgi:hypothetical protein